MELVEVLRNPVRIRIINTVMDGREFTAASLLDSLPDVSRPTLYRQLAVLLDAGILVVHHEERRRGAVERTYRFAPGGAAMPPAEMAALTTDDHQSLFAAAMSVLASSFQHYLHTTGADPYRDKVSYIQLPVWLTDDERAHLITQLEKILESIASNSPEGGRHKYLISPIFFPLPT
ncbi:helix-turn-helix domain-containing protein [Nocardia sp. NPDC024068]|uniref:helix-turn-helix domain-containing protein n=1 Tax=Nocardia sp. NPDC024068 TaxID=3157197 RepID=UPI0033C07191